MPPPVVPPFGSFLGFRSGSFWGGDCGFGGCFFLVFIKRLWFRLCVYGYQGTIRLVNCSECTFPATASYENKLNHHRRQRALLRILALKSWKATRRNCGGGCIALLGILRFNCLVAIPRHLILLVAASDRSDKTLSDRASRPARIHSLAIR